jgi:DNA polymerase III sliding clamp (beta) subunit (PCNA family)
MTAIDRQLLVNALNSVAVASSTKGHPYGNYILLTPHGSDLSIACDSLQLRAEAAFGVDGENLPGPALVPFDKLAALLQREVENVELAVDGDSLRVGCGKLSTIPAENFPAHRITKTPTAFLTLPEGFSKRLHLACGCAGDGTRHIWDSGVLITDDGANLAIYAGDGRQFFRSHLQTTATRFKTLLPAKLVRPIANLIDSDGATMAVYDNGVKFDTEAVTLFVQAMDNEYGPVAKLATQVDPSLKNQVRVNRHELLEAIQIGAAMLEVDEFGLTLEMSAEAKAVVVESVSKVNNHYRQEVATKVEAGMPARTVNHQMVIPYLRSLGTDEIVLNYDADPKAPVMRVDGVGLDGVGWYVGFMSGR